MSERHAVLFVCYNRTPEQLELSKLALNSVLAQDIGALDIHIVNNGSDAATRDWIEGLTPFGCSSIGGRWLYRTHHESNRSPVAVSNEQLKIVFAHHDKVLSVPNDVILPPNAYRLMNEWPRGFVSASLIEDRHDDRSPADSQARGRRTEPRRAPSPESWHRGSP